MKTYLINLTEEEIDALTCAYENNCMNEKHYRDILCAKGKMIRALKKNQRTRKGG